MRKILLFLTTCGLALFVPWNVMADDGYYTDEAEQIVDSSQEIAESLRKDYAELEEQILKIEPYYASLVQANKDLTDEQKLTIARSYLAQKAFDYYKDTFMSELEQRGKETGRKVVSEDYNTDNSIGTASWLDRGKLDTAECYKDGKINGVQICKYPDGFENVGVEIEKFNGTDIENEIFYYKDTADKNTVQQCMISLGYETYNFADDIEEIFNDELSLRSSCLVYEYDNFYAVENQEIQSVLTGKSDKNLSYGPIFVATYTSVYGQAKEKFRKKVAE
ncbi:MAG: hypothetical protein ACLRFJ_03800 [Alphaproteobacteria bacterium]